MMFGWMNANGEPLTEAELDGLLESTSRFLDAKLVGQEPGFLGVTMEWTHTEYDKVGVPVTPQLLQANIVMWYDDVVPSTRDMYYIGILSSMLGDTANYITNYVRTSDPSDSVLKLTTHFGWHFHDLLVEP